MAEANETIADIIAEMRGDGHTGPADALEWVRIKLEYYADRLDAAHRREISERVTRAVKNTAKIIDEQKRVGDAAELRKALKHIKDRLPHMLQYMRVHWEDASAGGYFDELMLVIDAALAEPARNCDVGSAEAQMLYEKGETK